MVWEHRGPTDCYGIGDFASFTFGWLTGVSMGIASQPGCPALKSTQRGILGWERGGEGEGVSR